jgi:plastocyanin
LILYILLGLGGVAGLVFIFPAVFSLTSNFHGSSHGPPFTPQEVISEVYIPEGTNKRESGQNFSPHEITVEISKDNKVRWYNNDLQQMSVVSDNMDDSGIYNDTHQGSGGPTAASLLYPDELFEYTFSKAGTFAYHCSFHDWMHGTVTVIEQIR